MIRRSLQAIAFFSAANPAHVQTVTGFVGGNHDGDAIEVTLISGDARLANLDAPEIHAIDWPTQPYDQRAKRPLRPPMGEDGRAYEGRGIPYQHEGRPHEIVATIAAPFNVSEDIIREGTARAYDDGVRDYDRDPALQGREQIARQGGGPLARPQSYSYV